MYLLYSNEQKDKMMKDNRCFNGIMTALVTPLDKEGGINLPVVEELVEFQLAAGINGFYLCGGTGEGISLDAGKRMKMVETVVKANRGRGKIIVQVGSINPYEAVQLAEHAGKSGVDGISSIPPTLYYNYTESEVVSYYRELVKCAALPLLVYRTPVLNGAGIVSVIEKLLQIDHIIGLKYTGSSYFEMWKLLQINGGNINVINGADETLLCGLVTGAHGGIGAVYNVIPQEFIALYRAFMDGDLAKAQKHQDKICRVIAMMSKFIRGGGIVLPVKTLLETMGFAVGSPLFPAEGYPPEERKQLSEAFHAIMNN